ncbi:hypothetical protein FOZ63_008095, partial [Perkinsus olseni]|uniref:Uncharacterized protein n=1 Tax=Perkinsus olseni TaxID=32597 RepID=A0A7J6SXR2_PEROL
MSSVSAFAGRLVAAIIIGLLALEVEAGPSGTYCGSILILHVTMDFGDDTFDVDAKLLNKHVSAKGVSYTLPNPTTIKVNVDDPNLKKALSDLGNPLPVSDLATLGYANNEIKASTDPVKMVLGSYRVCGAAAHTADLFLDQLVATVGDTDFMLVSPTT